MQKAGTGGEMLNLRAMVERAVWACVFAWQGLRHGEPRRSAGQSVIETALIIAIVAVVAIPATQLLREGFASAYLIHSEALALPSTSPSPSPSPTP
jgi:hypothetical protein